jgi:hypothetical protein
MAAQQSPTATKTFAQKKASRNCRLGPPATDLPSLIRGSLGRTVGARQKTTIEYQRLAGHE